MIGIMPNEESNILKKMVHQTGASIPLKLLILGISNKEIFMIPFSI
jgi:hypothetical protein